MEADVRVDFFFELDSRNLDHIIDQICASNLTHRDVVNLHQVCKYWNEMFHKNEGIKRGSIWHRVLHFRCQQDNLYKYVCILNRWWPDNNKIDRNIFPNLPNGMINDFYEDEEGLRRCALFESVDIALDLKININIEEVKKRQTRLLFAGGIVSTMSFCGSGGRYLFCGMLNGDIKLWELWKYDMNSKRKSEVLGRAWKVFKGHQERINGLDFLEVQDSNTKHSDIIFASASNDYSFRVWSVLTGSQLRVVRCGTGKWVCSILILEDRIMTVTSTRPRKYDVTEHVDINLYKGAFF